MRRCFGGGASRCLNRGLETVSTWRFNLETIEVRYKPVGFDDDPFLHKYIIYRDRHGKEWIARAGPGGNNIDSPLGSDIVVEIGPYGTGSKDWDDGHPYDREEIASGENLSKEWAAIAQKMTEVGNAQYPYRLRSQNSNTSVDNALLAAKLKLPSKYSYLVPGSGREFKFAPPINNGVFPHPGEWQANPPHVMRDDEAVPPGALEFMAVVGHPDAAGGKVGDLTAKLSDIARESGSESREAEQLGGYGLSAPSRVPHPNEWQANPPHVMRDDETVLPGALDFMSVVGHPDAPLGRVQDLPATLSGAPRRADRDVGKEIAAQPKKPAFAATVRRPPIRLGGWSYADFLLSMPALISGEAGFDPRRMPLAVPSENERRVPTSAKGVAPGFWPAGTTPDAHGVFGDVDLSGAADFVLRENGVIGKGAEGEEVRQTQRFLVMHGVTDDLGRPLVEDGRFTPFTRQAWQKYQRRHSQLVADGKVGSATLEQMISDSRRPIKQWFDETHGPTPAPIPTTGGAADPAAP
jgi:hypothetical protein